MKTFDVVVVGSGTGGQTAAYDLNAAGLKVAVIDRSDRPGGTCALAGCQPKKWFYEATEAIAKTRHLTGKGVEAAPRAVDEAAKLQILIAHHTRIRRAAGGVFVGLTHVDEQHAPGATGDLRGREGQRRLGQVLLAVDAGVNQQIELRGPPAGEPAPPCSSPRRLRLSVPCPDGPTAPTATCRHHGRRPPWRVSLFCRVRLREAGRAYGSPGRLPAVAPLCATA